MQIRLLDKKDAFIYRELRLQALRTDPQAFLSTFEFESQKYISTYEWEIQGSRKPPLEGYYGCFDSEKLIGYVQISKSGLPKQNHVMFLYNLYLDPTYRGKKIGHYFLSNIIDQIKKNDLSVEQIRLTHIDENLPAHKLYQDLGFVVEATKKNVIKFDTTYNDEIEMVLDLTNMP